jgi:enterochelin esterase-like enzyme
MKNTITIMILAMFTGGCGGQQNEDAIPRVSSGSIERIDNVSSEYFSARNVDVWLPEGYDKSRSYPVLYMHDGQMLFDASITWIKQEWGVDEVASRLIREEKIKPCIVVGIWNSAETRHGDYFPQKPFESLPRSVKDSLLEEVKKESGNPVFGRAPRSDDYLKFLVRELKPHIDSHYSTKPGREHTFIAGSSMGGLVSWYALCEYPKTFGGAACLSTHWIGTYETENNPLPGAFMEYLRKNLPDPATHKIYFDYGTRALDAFYEPYQSQVDRIMKEKGYDRESWQTRKFKGADHSENAWRARLHIPLEFLLNKNPHSGTYTTRQ